MRGEILINPPLQMPHGGTESWSHKEISSLQPKFSLSSVLPEHVTRAGHRSAGVSGLVGRTTQVMPCGGVVLLRWPVCCAWLQLPSAARLPIGVGLCSGHDISELGQSCPDRAGKGGPVTAARGAMAPDKPPRPAWCGSSHREAQARTHGQG